MNRRERAGILNARCGETQSKSWENHSRWFVGQHCPHATTTISLALGIGENTAAADENDEQHDCHGDYFFSLRLISSDLCCRPTFGKTDKLSFGIFLVMYDVLLCVDAEGTGLDRLIDAIIVLPEATESVHVIVCHVFGDNPSGASVTQVASVRRALDELEEADIEASTVGESGNPADTILRVADEHDADTIYIGGQKRSPAGKALFGSVAQSIFLNANRPVTLV